MTGIVFEQRENNASVRYIRNGILQHTAECTDIKNLRILSFSKKFNLNLREWKLEKID